MKAKKRLVGKRRRNAVPVAAAVKGKRKAAARPGAKGRKATGKRKAAARPNLKRRNAAFKANGAQGAKALFERFHGEPSKQSRDYTVARHHHEHLAELGRLISLKVEMPEGSKPPVVELRFIGVTLACSEDGGQLYFVGGDQVLNLAKLDLEGQLPKDHVIVGPVAEITYETRKGFDDFKTIQYFHEFGEEGGEMPSLCYDVKSRLLYLVGGSYRVEPAGIIN